VLQIGRRSFVKRHANALESDYTIYQPASRHRLVYKQRSEPIPQCFAATVGRRLSSRSREYSKYVADETASGLSVQHLPVQHTAAERYHNREKQHKCVPVYILCNLSDGITVRGSGVTPIAVSDICIWVLISVCRPRSNRSAVHRPIAMQVGVVAVATYTTYYIPGTWNSCAQFIGRTNKSKQFGRNSNVRASITAHQTGSRSIRTRSAVERLTGS